MTATVQGRAGFDSPLVARVGELAGASRSLPRVLDRIVAVMAEHGFPGAGISLINERAELYVVAYDGPADDDILALRLPVGRGIMGTVAADGRPMLIDDLDDPDGPVPVNRSVGGNARLRSLVAVPILIEGTVIGVLEVDSTLPGRFSAADQDVFEQVAARIAGAVHAAAPLELAGELLRQRVHELMILEETARALAASLDPDAVHRAVVRSAALGLGAPIVVLLGLDGARATVLAETDAFAAEPHARSSAAAWLRAVAEAAPGAVTSVAVEDTEAAFELAPGTLRGRWIVAIPVVAGGEFSGALVVAGSHERALDDAEQRLLEGIADLAGLAIGNAARHRRLTDSADVDALTGLCNRARFEREVAAHQRADAIDAFAILSIDVDRLKVINDTYGHESGDALIRAVGETIRNLVDRSIVVARTGADDFGVLLPMTDARAAVALAEEIRAAMHGVVVPFGVARVSVGVAAARPGADARATWSAADSALQCAKQWGRDRVEYADPSVTPTATASTRWDAAVVELMASRGLESVYQPIVRLDTLTVVAHEALARPLGAAPDSSVEGLFDAAHRSRWTRELDWLARRAAVHGARLLAPGLPLFVNCSVGALLDPVHDVDQMLLLLRWAERSPEDVVLEITEHEVVDDLDRFREVLAAYRAAGFRFAIDDVGEGHSTLEVLAAGEPEFVKLARSLTVSSHLLGHRSAIRAVVAFARSSGATIIAEGIEEEHQAEIMTAMHINHGQGWWLGRPIRLLPACIELSGTLPTALPLVGGS